MLIIRRVYHKTSKKNQNEGSLYSLQAYYASDVGCLDGMITDVVLLDVRNTAYVHNAA